MVYDFEGARGRGERPQRRASPRRRIMKGAVLVTDEGVFDCVVLELSDTGARVRSLQPVELTGPAMLKLTGGARYSATRRWAKGQEMGLWIEEDVSEMDAKAMMAWRVYEDVRMLSIRQSIGLMKAVDFFGDAKMRAEAERVEEGLRKLECDLANRARAQ